MSEPILVQLGRALCQARGINPDERNPDTGTFRYLDADIHQAAREFFALAVVWLDWETLDDGDEK